MKKERTITVTYSDKECDPKMPIYFIEFINEIAKVNKEEKEKEKEKGIKTL